MMLAEPRRTAWDLKWRMFGIPCRVHPLFWLTAVMLIYDIAHPALTPMPVVALWVACMFLSIVVHEYGHAFAGRYYGDDENHTVLYWMGGLCIGGKGTPERMPRIIELLWGPGAGFILGGIALGVETAANRGLIPLQNSYARFFLQNLIYVNFVWGAVNLFPVFPLDGGQIVREIVHWKAPARGDVLAFTISMYTALALTCASIGFAFYLSTHGGSDFRDLIPALLFGQLAYSSYRIRQQVELYGDMEGFAPERREAWEQDPDWWKRGGR